MPAAADDAGGRQVIEADGARAHESALGDDADEPPPVVEHGQASHASGQQQDTAARRTVSRAPIVATGTFMCWMTSS